MRGDSINQVAILGVRQGHELVISATGADADEALAALQALFATNFGEDDTALPPVTYTASSYPSYSRRTFRNCRFSRSSDRACCPLSTTHNYSYAIPRR